MDKFDEQGRDAGDPGGSGQRAGRRGDRPNHRKRTRGA